MKAIITIKDTNTETPLVQMKLSAGRNCDIGDDTPAKRVTDAVIDAINKALQEGE